MLIFLGIGLYNIYQDILLEKEQQRMFRAPNAYILKRNKKRKRRIKK